MSVDAGGARIEWRYRLQHRPILRFGARRFAASVVLLLIASALIFAGTQLLPGDAATAVLGRNATPEALASVRADLRLDQPLLDRYASWLSGFVRGDLGRSLVSQQPVSDLVGDRFLNSAILALVAAAVLFPLAIGLGVVAAVRRGRAVDHAVSGLSLTFIAVPEFVLGTFLALIFAVNLKLVPPVSLVPPGSSPLSKPSLLVLPVATLVLVGSAYMIRMVRAGMIEALASDYVQMARLRGVGERRVVLYHALRNALAPTVQVGALTLQWLIGGIVIVETVFGYPGIGQGLVQGVVARDIPYVASVSMVLAIVYVAIAAIADLLVVLLIPRLRTAA